VITVGERMAHLPGIDVSVAEAGVGGAPLLLVHGFTGAKEDFGDWMGRFAAAGFWAVAPDLRGHGASAKPPEEADYSLAVFADDLEALADDLGWDRIAVVGHSMGGAVAQELVLRDPGRIEKLVLMDTHHAGFEGLGPDVVQMGVEIIHDQGLPALLELMEAFKTAPPAPADQRMRDTRPGYVEWNDAKLAAVSPAMYAVLALELVTRPDRLPELAELAVPTLVMVGEQDTDLLAAAERMGAAIPDARHVVIPEAAHSPQLENPDVWWETVSSFFAS
jgi:pimeloyl-ACP methyl ester carboxylesterase